MITQYKNSPCLTFDIHQGSDRESPALVIGTNIAYRDGSDMGRKCPKHKREGKVLQLRSQPLSEKTVEDFRDFVELGAYSFKQRLQPEIEVKRAAFTQKEQLKLLAKEEKEQAIIKLPGNSPNDIAKKIVKAAGDEDYSLNLVVMRDVVVVLCESALVKYHPFIKVGAFDKEGNCIKRLVVRRVTALFRLLQRSPDYSDGADEENALKVLSDVLNTMKERDKKELEKETDQ